MGYTKSFCFLHTNPSFPHIYIYVHSLFVSFVFNYLILFLFYESFTTFLSTFYAVVLVAHFRPRLSKPSTLHERFAYPLYVRTKKASLFSLLLLHTVPIKILFSTYRIKKHICISFFFPYTCWRFFFFSFLLPFMVLLFQLVQHLLNCCGAYVYRGSTRKGWSFLHKRIFPAIHFHIIIKYVSRFLWFRIKF